MNATKEFCLARVMEKRYEESPTRKRAGLHLLMETDGAFPTPNKTTYWNI
jgi:hypothetical protein